MAAALVALQFSSDATTKLARCWEEAHAGSDGPPECLLDGARSVAPSVLAPAWGTLDDAKKRRFENALAAAMHRDLVSMGDAEPEQIATASEGVRSTLRYRLAGHEVSVQLVEDRVIDVVWDDGSLRQHYRRLCEDLLEAYSFEYLVGELTGRGVIVLEDFDDQPEGELPRGWKWRAFGDDVEVKPYWIAEENGNRFLRAEDRGENVMLYKEVPWSSAAYPYVSWRWRIRSVPDGADARYEASADNAAGVYLTYRRKLGLVPETVKFIWSERLRRGGAFRRPGIGMPWTVVAGSGDADASEWHRVVYRVSDVYGKTFGGSAGRRPLGIGVLSDANNTGSFASADYDDFVALREADDVEVVEHILDIPN